MNATFHFRQKITCAVAFHSSTFSNAVAEALESHPWFSLVPQNQAQLVWSDRLVTPASKEQRILYLGAVEGAAINLFDCSNHRIPQEKAIYLPSPSAKALSALLKALQPLAGISSMQLTAMLPPDLAIPSMALFYQPIVAAEEQFAGPLKRELLSLLGTSSEAVIMHSMITALYLPVRQGPFLTLNVQMDRAIALNTLLSSWREPLSLPATPSMLSAQSTPSHLLSQEPFILYQEAIDAPYVQMQRESCLIGNLTIDENQMRVCVVPPHPVLSLLASTEYLVMSGSIYW